MGRKPRSITRKLLKASPILRRRERYRHPELTKMSKFEGHAGASLSEDGLTVYWKKDSVNGAIVFCDV